MKLLDMFIPYNLMSMHPSMHVCLLITGTILLSSNYDNFYTFVGTCPPEAKDAIEFMATGKYALMNIAITSHIVCIVLHYLYQYLNYCEQRTIATICILMKMFVYFLCVLKIQDGIDFT